MLREEQITPKEAAPLLRECGLFPVAGGDYTVGIRDEQDELVAVGALVGDMLQMLAVKPSRRGEGLTARVVSSLLRQAGLQGVTSVYMIAKAERAPQFAALGFRLVISTPQSALLEFGSAGVEEACRRFSRCVASTEGAGCVVMNANPFTLGHRYLVEKALCLCPRIVVLAVEEERSQFPFAVRLDLMQKGLKDLPGVTVLPGSRYVLSALTFPAYFLRDAQRSKAESEMDAALFIKYIAPSLHITDRFLGEEPLSPSTALYNRTLEALLPPSGIRVHVIPRLLCGGVPVSASLVRRLVAEGKLESVRPLVPASTFAYLEQNREEAARLCRG